MSRFGRLLLTLTVFATPGFADEALGPDAVHRDVASMVAVTLKERHYGKRPFDDALSKEWLSEYLDTLDYSRIYFLASDVGTFEATWQSKLDDDILSPEPTLDAAFQVHEVYRKRVEERISFALATLASADWAFDNADWVVDLDRHEESWASTSEELDSVWTDRLGEQLLRMELAGEERAVALSRLTRRYERIRADIQSLEPADIVESYLGAMSRIFDPHSAWFKPITKENFDIDMADSLTGIGAELRQDDGYTVITRLIPGGPAHESKELQEQDKIVAVAQDGADPDDVVDMRLDKVVQLIRGTVDTDVVLTIQPGDATDPSERHDVRLTRKKVKLDRAAAKGEVREVDGVKVGVVDIPSFYRDSAAKRAGLPWGGTTKDTEKILEGFRLEGVDVAIIDLRRNGGGRLDEALDLTGLFIGDTPIVQIKSRDDKKDVLRPQTSHRAVWTGPVIVLTSEVSASASEIFAAAIQDHKRGLIVGSKQTHGKGTVQDLQDFGTWLTRAGKADQADRGGALKYTTHMFFRPSGGSTQQRGVAADLVLPSPYEGMDIREGDLEHALEWDRVKSAAIAPRELPIDLEDLSRSSAKRVAQSMEFAFMHEDILERARTEDMEFLSLHRATRQAEIDRSKARSEARESARKAAGWDGETDPDPILDEAVLIARDVVRQLRG